MEIGFGMGEATAILLRITLAMDTSQLMFTHGIGKLLARIVENDLTNLRSSKRMFMLSCNT
jgi:tRNA G46 methylase TrmB